MTQLAFHRYANIFPLIEGEEFFALAEDIRQHGLRDRIDLIEVDGGLQILDGRNRYRALVWLVSTGEVLGEGWADMAGEPLTAEYLADYENLHIYVIGDEETDGDPLDYVISKNLPRRHLTDDDRRMVAATLVELRQGRPDKTSQFANISRDKAAKLLNTDVAGVDRARSVISRAAPEIVQAAREGKVSVAAAAEIAAQPAERQAAIVAALPRDAEGKLTPEVKKALAPIVKEMRAEKVAAKKERRAEREQDLGRKLQALPEKMFGVAIEDFEWDHETWSRETGTERHPSMHYETAEDAHTPEEIAARCAERFACLAEDCIIFKWTTIPHLAIAIRVLELQGFRYVTHLVWNKVRPGAARGSGYWFTGEHEIVLVGVRGKVVSPATAHFRSNFSAPVGEHSEKPDNLHEIIEFHWPNTPKVEFNARRARPGWKRWGFDAPSVSPEGEIAPATDASDSSSSACEGTPSPREEVAIILDGGRRTSKHYLTAAEIDDYSARYQSRDTVCPPGHAIGMTLADDVEKQRVTCSCGATFQFPLGEYRALDAAIEIHFTQAEFASVRPEPKAIGNSARKRAAAANDRPLSDREIFDALAAIEADNELVKIKGPILPALVALGLIWEVPGSPGCYDLTPLGCDRLEAGIPASADEHRQLVDEIANGSGATPTAEPPAPSADVAPADRGEVVSDAAADAAAARADAAVSPANRPGANSDDDGLDIPSFLRRAPVASPVGDVDIAQTEMDLARIDRAPAEVVDDRLQTRLPLTDDEVELRTALLAIDAGTECEWSIVRQAIGAGYAHATTTRIMVTEAGREFLAQLAGPSVSLRGEIAVPAAIEARA